MWFLTVNEHLPLTYVALNQLRIVDTQLFKTIVNKCIFMSIEEEIKMWVYFWCGSGLIFLILWVFTQINFKRKNKRNLRNK